MTRAYATIANDGKRVDGSIMGNVPRVVQEVRFRKSGKARRNAPVGKASSRPARRRRSPRSSRRSSGRAPARARSSRRQVRRARRARTTTTPTPGSSATRPTRRRGLGRLPERAQPMETEFHGEPVAGGTLPGLIWKAFMTRALADRPRRRSQSAPYLPSTTSSRVPRRSGGGSTTGSARRRASCRTSRDGSRPRRRPATRTRSRSRAWSAVGRVRARRARFRPLAADVISRPREGAHTARGQGREAAAAWRLPLGQRQRAALGVDGPGRPRPEPRRLEPARCKGAEPEAQARASVFATGTGRPARCSSRARAGDRDPAGLPITLLVGRGSTN
jgi:hypothetical protein